jgi:hypothetical protein
VVTGPAIVVVPLEFSTTTVAPPTGAAKTEPVIVVVGTEDESLVLEPPQDMMNSKTERANAMQQ